MIKINYKKRDKKYLELTSTGHANHSEYGTDLVCAAITAIISGAMNAFDLKNSNDVQIKVEENLISIKLLNLIDQELQIMFEMMMIQIQTIEIQYPKNIKLKEVF